MAFNFGPTTTSRPSLFGGTQTGGLFGQQPAASTGFGFGQPTQSSGATGFGGFGTPATAAATGFSFGAPASSAPTGFGGGFGSTTTAPAPAFGFGTPAASSAPGLTFGTGTGFGAAAAPTGGSLFGSTPASASGLGLSTAPKFGTTFGASTGFGAATTPATGALGGLGSTSGGMFGAMGGTSAFGGGGMFGAKPATTLGGLGGGMFGATRMEIMRYFQLKPLTILIPAAAAAPVAAGLTPLAQLTTAVTAPVLFGDERDAVIAKWNQLQAFWGTGKAYLNQQGQAVDLTPDNPLSLFKAVGYACAPTSKNEDGLVALVVNRKLDDVRTNQQQIVDTLHRVFGSKPNLSVCVDSLKPLIDDRTELTFFVQDRSAAGTTTRISATDVQAYLSQQTQQLTPLSVTNMYIKSGMRSDQLKLYLDTPPSGIDLRIWDQAKLDNPDPGRLIPVPMVGFGELSNRLKHQNQQTELHQSRLDMLMTDIQTLRHNVTDMIAKLDQYKRSQLLLSHRLLKVLVGQEIHRKQGYAVQPMDEQLRARLESINDELNMPTQFKGRLNELMSQLRLQQSQMSNLRTDMSGYQLDKNVQLELKQHLKQQQDGLAYLIDIINQDLDDLRTIEQGISDSNNRIRR